MTADTIKLLMQIATIGLLLVAFVGVRHIWKMTIITDAPEGRSKEDGFRVGDIGRTRSGHDFEITHDLREHGDPRLKYYFLVSIERSASYPNINFNPTHVNEYVNRDGLVDEYNQHDNDLIWSTLL